MPRRGRKRTKTTENSDNSENESVTSSVANVNKHGEASNDQMSNKSVSRKSVRIASNAQNKKIKRSKRNEESTETSFVEDNQLMSVTVRASRSTESDDELLASDSESENEVSFRRDSQTEQTDSGELLSEGEIIDDSNEEHQETAAKEQAKPQKESILTQTKQGQQSLQDLDKEMVGKINELHKLMTQGGLTESAELLKKLSKQKTTEIEGMAVKNTNTNATMKNMETSIMSKSVDTIYEDAVPKRSSTSSDEDLPFNSSDEIDGAIDFNPNNQQIETFIADERRRVVDRGRPINPTQRMNKQNCFVDMGPSTSKGPVDKQTSGREKSPTPEERSKAMVQQAETAKAKIFSSAGKCGEGESNDGNHYQLMGSMPSAFVDESYIVVGAHSPFPEKRDQNCPE